MEIALRNMFEVFPFMEKLMAPHLQIIDGVVKYPFLLEAEETIEKLPAAFDRGELFATVCRQTTSGIPTYGDVLFGVYSSVRPTITISPDNDEINLLETPFYRGDRRLFVLETPVFKTKATFTPISSSETDIESLYIFLPTQHRPSGLFEYRHLVSGKVFVCADGLLEDKEIFEARCSRYFPNSDRL